MKVLHEAGNPTRKTWFGSGLEGPSLQFKRMEFRDGDILHEDISDISLSQLTTWMTRQNLEGHGIKLGSTKSHTPEELGYTGIYGFAGVTKSYPMRQMYDTLKSRVDLHSHQFSVLAYFLYPKKMSAVEALKVIEQYELSQGFIFPSILATHILAAQYGVSKSGQPVFRESPGILAFLDQEQLGHLPDKPSASHLLKLAYLPHDEIDSRARQFLLNLTAGEPAATLVPELSTDRARFWLSVTKHAFDEDILPRYPQDPSTGITLDNIGFCGMMLDRENTKVSISGISMPLSPPYYLAGMYRQLAELAKNDIPPDGVRIMFPRGHVYYEQNVLSNLAKGSETTDKLPVQRSYDFAQALLDEAEENAAFDLQGSAARIRLPQSSILTRVYGVSKISLWIQSKDRIWVNVKTNKVTGETFLWCPFSSRPIPGAGVIMPEHTAAYIHLHLAGLWHDLRTAGEAALIPEAGRRRRLYLPQKGKPATHSERSLPRKRHIFEHLTLEGNYQWGSDVERAGVPHVRHFVDGFTRYLPGGHKPSEKQKALARERGVILLLGETFVKGHFRGKRKENTEFASDIGQEEYDDLPPEKIYYAKGLVRLLTLPGMNEVSS